MPHFLMNVPSSRILRFLTLNGPSTCTEIACGTSIARSTARRHLARLQEAGCVTAHGAQTQFKGRATVYASNHEIIRNINMSMVDLLTGEGSGC